MNSLEMIGWHKNAQKFVINKYDDYIHVIDGYFSLTEGFNHDKKHFWHCCGWNDVLKFNLQQVKTRDLDDDVMNEVEILDGATIGKCLGCEEEVPSNIVTALKMAAYSKGV